MDRNQRRALRSWVFVVALALLCGVLAVLQYRWIGEVSRAERDRLRGSLRASLYRLSQDFNAEITTACAALLAGDSAFGPNAAGEEDDATRYAHWKSTSRHAQLFRRIAIAVPQAGTVVLWKLDPETGVPAPYDWPAEWSGVRERLTARVSSEPWREWRHLPQ